jgi:uncharacterized protein
MEVVRLEAPDLQLIQSCRPGGFTVSLVHWQGSILIRPEATRSWPVAGIDGLAAETLEALREGEPAVELLLIGTGERMALVAPAVRRTLRQWGIVAETMTTPAACRTYNVLVAEGRRVAAALMAMPAETGPAETGPAAG